MRVKRMSTLVLFALAVCAFVSGWLGSSFLHAGVVIKADLRPKDMGYNLDLMLGDLQKKDIDILFTPYTLNQSPDFKSTYEDQQIVICTTPQVIKDKFQGPGIKQVNGLFVLGILVSPKNGSQTLYYEFPIPPHMHEGLIVRPEALSVKLYTSPEDEPKILFKRKMKKRAQVLTAVAPLPA